jgi:phage terminase small subunit
MRAWASAGRSEICGAVADIRANGRVYTDEQGNIRSRGIIAEYRNLKRVSLAYARELGLTPVVRKQFKLDRGGDHMDKWVRLAEMPSSNV